jgi:hypothetical protein
MQSLWNGCGLLMLAKLRQLECVQGFVHLMNNFLETLGKIMEFLLPSQSAISRNGQQPVPVYAQSDLMKKRALRRRWTSRDLSHTGRTRHLNPSNRPFPWSPFSE